MRPTPEGGSVGETPTLWHDLDIAKELVEVELTTTALAGSAVAAVNILLAEDVIRTNLIDANGVLLGVLLVTCAAITEADNHANLNVIGGDDVVKCWCCVHDVILYDFFDLCNDFFHFILSVAVTFNA